MMSATSCATASVSLAAPTGSCSLAVARDHGTMVDIDTWRCRIAGHGVGPGSDVELSSFRVVSNDEPEQREVEKSCAPTDWLELSEKHPHAIARSRLGLAVKKIIDMPHVRNNCGVHAFLVVLCVAARCDVDAVSRLAEIGLDPGLRDQLDSIVAAVSAYADSDWPEFAVKVFVSTLSFEDLHRLRLSLCRIILKTKSGMYLDSRSPAFDERRVQPEDIKLAMTEGAPMPLCFVEAVLNLLPIRVAVVTECHDHIGRRDAGDLKILVLGRRL